MIRALALAFAVLLCAGCGQKGPLKLPTPSAPADAPAKPPASLAP